MSWTCTRCGSHVPGDSLQHCPGCHRTFGSTTAGDKHRTGGWVGEGPRRCVDPMDVGLVQDTKGTWRMPGGYWTEKS